jgi:hypothetical protein
LLPVLLTPTVTVTKFDAGVVDTGGKFATGVIDTGGAPLFVNVSANFRKNSTTLTLFSGAGWKLIHEKNLQQKIS